MTTAFRYSLIGLHAPKIIDEVDIPGFRKWITERGVSRFGVAVAEDPVYPELIVIRSKNYRRCIYGHEDTGRVSWSDSTIKNLYMQFVFEKTHVPNRSKAFLSAFPNRHLAAYYRTELFNRMNGCCFHCVTVTPVEKRSLDHFIPRKLGGADRPENCVPSCMRCNAKKSHLPPSPEDIIRFEEFWDNINRFDPIPPYPLSPEEVKAQMKETRRQARARKREQKNKQADLILEYNEGRRDTPF